MNTSTTNDKSVSSGRAHQLATTADDRACDRCGTALIEGDAPTEDLLTGGVYCSPKCASREAAE